MKKMLVQVTGDPKHRAPCAPQPRLTRVVGPIDRKMFANGSAKTLLLLEFLVAVLQAYVFTILSCLYLRDAIHLH